MSARDVQQILEFLSGHDDEGTPRFTAEEVRHAVPAIVFELLRANPSARLPAVLNEILHAWMKGAGLSSTSSSSHVLEALRLTYSRRPLNQDLKLGLAELLREAALESQSRFLRFTDAHIEVRAPAPPPKSSVPANPLARFALNRPAKTRKR